VPGTQNEIEQDRWRPDLYVPVNAKDFATVVWFHGGGLTQGSTGGSAEPAFPLLIDFIRTRSINR
jgi:hypothetical protein